MVGALIDLISKRVNKTVLIIILTVCISVTGVFSVSKYFVTAQELKAEITEVDNKVKTGDSNLENKIELESLKTKTETDGIKKEFKQQMVQQKLDVLHLQQGIKQQQVWDLDDRVDNSNSDEKKEKWKRRLKRAEDDLKEIEQTIDKIRG